MKNLFIILFVSFSVLRVDAQKTDPSVGVIVRIEVYIPGIYTCGHYFVQRANKEFKEDRPKGYTLSCEIVAEQKVVAMFFVDVNGDKVIDMVVYKLYENENMGDLMPIKTSLSARPKPSDETTARPRHSAVQPSGEYRDWEYIEQNRAKVWDIPNSITPSKKKNEPKIIRIM